MLLMYMYIRCVEMVQAEVQQDKVLMKRFARFETW